MNLMAKVKGVIAKNTDKAGSAIGKVADVADQRTGGKHSTQIRSAADKARGYVAKMDDDKPAQ